MVEFLPTQTNKKKSTNTNIRTNRRKKHLPFLFLSFSFFFFFPRLSAAIQSSERVFHVSWNGFRRKCYENGMIACYEIRCCRLHSRSHFLLFLNLFLLHTLCALTLSLFFPPLPLFRFVHSFARRSLLLEFLPTLDHIS